MGGVKYLESMLLTVPGVLYSTDVVVSREWNGCTKPMGVTGMGSNGYGCGYGFPYL